MSNSEPIGIIGLGLLGSALADRLQTLGYQVIAFDPNPLKVEHVTLCQNAAAVFEDCSRVFFSLPTSQVAKEVVTEVEKSLREGHLIFDTTTGAPEDVIALSKILEPRRISYLETNVAGSSQLLRKGEANFFLGGDESTASTETAFLKSICHKTHYLGPVGTASRFKLVHNLILGLNRAVLAEGMQFAESLGFDGGEIIAILQKTAAASGAMAGKGERMANRDFQPPEARLTQHLKDVRLMLEEANGSGAEVPLTTLHRELLEKAETLGLGDSDNSAVIEAFRPRPTS